MYERVFQSDNPFWRGMGRLFDVFVLNSLWLLCCIPVVTIGPSTTAFFYAMLNLVRGEETYLSKDFFRSFRRNFKQGLFLGVPLTLIGAFLAFDVRLAYKSGTGIFSFFMVFFAVLFLLWSFVTLYTFPLLAKFDNSSRNTLIWAFTLSIRHIPQTLLMLFVLAAALWLCHLLPGLVFIAFGLAGEFCATLLAAILKPWLPNTEAEDAETEDNSGTE